MMHKLPRALDISVLEACLPEHLYEHTVSAAVLALGSNHQADQHLPRVRAELSELGSITLSTAFDNADFTATKDQPKPDYTNQCVSVTLFEGMTLQQLQRTLKQLELDCDRQRCVQRSTKPVVTQVTMDIDLLLVQLNEGQWRIMADRYPFKAHERAGLKELAVL